MGSTGQKTVRIGVDVGGTNTDAVAIEPSKQFTESRGVLAHHKTPTTPDVTEGIEAAVRNVLQKSGLPSESIASVTVGTTHFINAVIEQDTRRLRRVAIIRISKSFLREVPPFSEFPPGLTSIIKGYVGYVDGGLHIDGSQEAPLVEEQVVERCAEIKKLGLSSIVVVGAFSPIDDHFHQEDRVRDIVLKEIPGADVVVSHEVANIGLLERENASILNAAILRYAKRTVKGFRRAMKALKLTCPLFLTQNDGTLLDSAAAAKIPIRTFSSGPTNSMRGAAYLTGHETGNQSAIVVDIGGTTTDVGVLLPSGLPRQASAYVTVAGVKVNYSMPSLHSIGLGGGSIVRQQGEKVTVGPDSVGHYLTRDALVFGGKVLTSSDIAVAAGKAQMGDSKAVESVDKALIPQAEERIKQLLEGAVDMIKTSSEPLPVLLVGGGAVLAPTSLKGASELKLPPYHDVANAVGAAISKVGGIVDIIQQIADISQTQAVERAKEMAIQKAVDAGAIKESIIIAEVETYPVTYMANQLRTIVKAVGELDINMQPSSLDDDEADGEDDAPEAAKDFAVKVVDEPPVDPRTYKPTIVKNEQGILEWQITETDINYLADGCYVLGCAGGGSPAASRIQLRDMLRAGYKMRCIRPEDLPEPGNIYWGGHMGSPATSNERLQSLETVKAFEALMEYLKEDTFDAVMGLEIGGANGIEPFLVGSSRFYDRPVIDADWMGRAYPTYWQTTIAVHAPGELVPCVIDSGDGKTIIMTKASNDEIVDRALRASCAEMGSRVGKAAKPTTSQRVRDYGVLNTVSLAWRIGRCIATAEVNNTLSTVAEQIVEQVGGTKSAKVLFRGKIVGVERRLFKGHSYGTITIASLSASEDDDSADLKAQRLPAVKETGTLTIPFKNENIYAEHVGEDGTKSIIASVPDLICVLDTGSGKNLGVPEFKYGYRVTVLGITCSPRWSDTPRGLEIGGPVSFGYDHIEYKPLGEYVEPRSVIEEYAPK
ncbi:putative D-/L-hydantoinase subunit A [Pseudocercospora fuligena]|uniref:Putative D-/L-hydantoinase subunit A n=1 Tax=Pseudocercospora fuligena TaxID=685502 RepID=A0A8H6RUT5_9PEZI|nr:putative D-/L-hydantoinase subunit A [Pseudocercospora fuligena]